MGCTGRPVSKQKEIMNRYLLSTCKLVSRGYAQNMSRTGVLKAELRCSSAVELAYIGTAL